MGEPSTPPGAPSPWASPGYTPAGPDQATPPVQPDQVQPTPPAPDQGAPAQGYGPPAQGYGPPAQGYGPPGQGYGAPAQRYGVPTQGYPPAAPTFAPPTGPHRSPGGSGQYTFPSLEKPKLDPLAPASIAAAPIAPLGLALGIASLRRIRRNRLRGRGAAVTGVILSSIFLAALLLVVATFALDGTFTRMWEEPVAGDVPSARTAASVNLDVGNCVVTLPVSPEVGEVTLTPCAEDHHFQVTARIPATGDAYPGADDLFAEAGGLCQDAFSAISSTDAAWPEGYEPAQLVPSPENWEDGERHIICLVRSTAGQVTTDLVNG